MQLRKERIQRIISDLGGLIVKQSVPTDNWKIKEGFFLRPSEAEAASEKWKDFYPSKDNWGGNDKHFWFQKEIVVPKEFDGKALYIYVCTDVTYWDAVNPQFLLFVNDEIVQGIDINHRQVLISNCAKEGETLKIDLQAYTGRNTTESGDRTKQMDFYCSLQEVDSEVLGLYFDLLSPFQMSSWYDDSNESRRKVEVVLNDAINFLDFRDVYSKDFYNGVSKAKAYLKEELYTKLAGNDEIIATCIGHTHIDIAWWWTVSQTREKAVRSFATVLKLMELYPNYKFMSSQPILYKFVKERYPEMYEKIKERVAEGRWEVEGGMWVEADCNVTSGESLVRQLLHGKQYFKKEFNKDNKILWLPDVFGYSAALPQILKKSGVDYFMTTKISWNQVNKLPHDTFMWKGIDGTEVFTHLITTQDLGTPKGSFNTTYNGSLNAVSAIRAYDRYSDKDINNDVLLSIGHGDGGGGTTAEMIETGNRLEAGITGIPKVRFETARNYFDSLYERTKDVENIPKWMGELYLEYHRGTYTSMARNKRGNRKNEFLWQDVEMTSIWAEKLGAKYLKDEIYDSWETILTNQFHDILPGSSIHEVYEVTKEEYTHLENRAHEIINNNLQLIADETKGNKGDVIVLNTLSFDRDDVIVLDGKYDGLSNENGEALAVQPTADNKTAVTVKGMKGKGITRLIPSAKKENATPFAVAGKTVSTPFYDVEFNDSYEIIRLYDKKAEREVVPKGKVANALIAYEDKPIYYDAWDIDCFYSEKKWRVNDVTSVEWTENGPVRAVLSVKRMFSKSEIVQNIIFYAEREGIDFQTTVDWKQSQVLLKAEFDVDINATEATFDIQFGEAKRPAHKNTKWDSARFEVCAHKWIDMSEGNFGVSILNESKYGHNVYDQKMGITLIKSGIVPNPVADQEVHNFTYMLYPHKNSYRDADTIKLGYMLNVPVYSVVKQKDGSANDIDALLSCCGCVAVETVKKAEDGNGTIIRVIENKNSRKKVCVKWNNTFTNVTECDLMENDINSALCVSSDNKSFSFEIKPFEIKTFRIQ